LKYKKTKIVQEAEWSSKWAK